MKTGYTNSPVSNNPSGSSEQGFSIRGGRFTFAESGMVTDLRSGLLIGSIQYMREDTLSATVLAARREWADWLAEQAPAARVAV